MVDREIGRIAVEYFGEEIESAAEKESSEEEVVVLKKKRIKRDDLTKLELMRLRHENKKLKSQMHNLPKAKSSLIGSKDLSMVHRLYFEESDSENRYEVDERLRALKEQNERRQYKIERNERELSRREWYVKVQYERDENPHHEAVTHFATSSRSPQPRFNYGQKYWTNRIFRGRGRFGANAYSSRNPYWLKGNTGNRGYGRWRGGSRLSAISSYSSRNPCQSEVSVLGENFFPKFDNKKSITAKYVKKVNATTWCNFGPGKDFSNTQWYFSSLSWAKQTKSYRDNTAPFFEKWVLPPPWDEQPLSSTMSKMLIISQ